MQKIRPYILSIGGFDPSGGAGVLADVKTSEAHKTLGISAISSVTYQNENKFSGLQWLSFEEIKKQLIPLFELYKIEFVKIGLIENKDSLKKIVNYLLKRNPEIRIIWDPVLKSSSDFVFHGELQYKALISVLKKVYLITPNWNEIQKLVPDSEPLKGASILSKYCNVYLKGGHNAQDIGRDFLFYDNKQISFKAAKISGFQKHGSGCVLASSIASNLAKGFKLKQACLRSKQYIFQFLNSNPGELGYHKL